MIKTLKLVKNIEEKIIVDLSFKLFISKVFNAEKMI